MSFMTTNRSSLRRKVFLGTSLLVFGTFLAASAASCVTLPDIPGNQCGNYVVEPDNDEACDENTDACGAPSTLGACRFICDYQDAAGTQCPAGLGCGLDGICRKPGGLAESPISIAGGGTQKLLSGDFDGDERRDIVAVGFNTADVHFLTTEGYIDRTVTLPNERGVPGIGDVDGDARDDIVLALDYSVGVLLGQEDRSFAPQSYATMFVPPNTKRLIPLGGFTFDGEMLAFTENGGNTLIQFITLNQFGGHESKSAGPPILGIVEGAVATRGVKVGGLPCGIAAFEVDTPGPGPWNLVFGLRCKDPTGQDIVEIEDILVPIGAPWGGAYFGDADDDGLADLFFGIDNGDPSLKVIRQDMSGQNLPAEDFLDFEAGNCRQQFPALASPPLAIGDVNGDSYPDFVDSRGILLFDPIGPKRFTRVCHLYSYTDPMDPGKVPVSWSHAIIGDFNGDGQDDILASRKGEGVLDLWTWQLGGFNTIPIYVGGQVEELITGDLDGDTIADAAFRFMPPMGEMGPTPLLAMFGNPLALPSKPQALGFVERMQHIAAGRIKGVNSAEEPDLLSDVVVISSGMMPNEPMALTLFQGNSTRNLVAPLSLQKDTTQMPVELTDQVYGLFVSDFASSACDRFDMINTDAVTTPSNVVALGDTGRIWLAGCKANGSSMQVQENLDVLDATFLFAPVDNSSTTRDLAIFMSNPPFDDGTSMTRSLGLGTIEHQGGEMFSTLPNPMPPIDAGILLPSLTNLDVPFAITDVDGNGLRDVIVTGKTGSQHKIFIFWNGDIEDKSGKMSADVVTEFNFKLPANPGNGPMPPIDESDIRDIVALNIDSDPYGELAILTKDHVYLADLDIDRLPKNRDGEPQLLDVPSFANIRGGEALLAIDADSDGIDDLIVADTGKLLLFVGTESR